MKVRTLVLLLMVATVVLVAASPVFSEQPITVSGCEQEKKLKHMVQPVYPSDAKEAGVEGDVLLSVVIDEAGAAKSIKVVKGPLEFRAASVEAVGQWKWDPTYLNGKPVAVRTDIKVSYKLHPPQK